MSDPSATGEEAVAALPGRLEALAADHSRLQAMQAAGQQLWQSYGLPGFAVDVRAFLRDPMAVLSARARQQLPDAPVQVAATSPAEPSRSVLPASTMTLLRNACRFASRRPCGSVSRCSVAAREL